MTSIFATTKAARTLWSFSVIIFTLMFIGQDLSAQSKSKKAGRQFAVQDLPIEKNPQYSNNILSGSYVPSEFGTTGTNSPGWQTPAESSLFTTNGTITEVRGWCLEYYDLADTGGTSDIFDFADENRLHGPQTTADLSATFDALNDPAFTEGDPLYKSIALAIWAISDGTLVPGDADAQTIVNNVISGTYQPQAFVMLQARLNSLQDFIVPLQLIDTIPEVTQDLGDLPESFDTTISLDGPRHTVVPNLYLGSCITAENDGHPDERGSGIAGLDGLAGDDADFGIKEEGNCTGLDDEDGVQLSTPLIPGYQACIAITATNGLGSANLYGWIDYNGDGDFDSDANELLSGGDFAGGSASFTGNQSDASFCFDVPSSATFDGGETHMRFRLTTDALTSPTPWAGTASDGEIEDYYTPLACVGNLVWLDDGNGGGFPNNGIQDGSEAGISGLDVNLEWAGPDGEINTAGDNLVYTSTTLPNGTYNFCGLRAADVLVNSVPESSLLTDTTTEAITDNACFSTVDEVIRTFNVTESFIVESVVVGLNVSHIRRGDIISRIESPSGTQVALVGLNMTDTFDNLNVCFDDVTSNPMNSGSDDNTAAAMCARQVKPANALSNFDGENAQGTWTMYVCDDRNNQIGSFLGAQLDVSGSTQTTSAAGNGSYQISIPNAPLTAPFLSPEDATADHLDSDGIADGPGATAPVFTIVPADYSTPTDGSTYFALPLSEAGFQDNPGSINGYPDSRDDLTFDFGFFESLLPVELERFEAGSINSGIHVEWTTISEKDNAGFSLEIRGPGTPFQEATFIEGAGSSDQNQHYSYDVENLHTGIYNLRLKQIDFDGSYNYSKIIEVDLDLGRSFQWDRAYPNPFNPSTTIGFSVKEQGQVSMKLYDLEGRVVKKLFAGHTQSGSIQRVHIEASNLPSGTYIVRIEGKDFSATQPIVLLK